MNIREQITHRNSGPVTGSSDALQLSLFHLSNLLQAGVSLSDALGDIESQEPKRRMSRIWSDIRTRVAEGKTLSDALLSWPEVFDPVVVALVRAGEASGRLAESCETIQQLLRWHAAVKARLITVLIYPCIALMIMLGVIGFLFVSVVPSMQVFLVNNHSAITWHTTVLLRLSERLVVYMVPAAGMAIVLFFVILALRHFLPVVRYSCDRFALKIPVLGRLIAELSLSRYAKTVSRLYGSGVSLEQSMKISEDVVENTALRLELGRVRYQMLAGFGLGQSMQSAQFVSISLKRLLAAGETSAALEQAFSQASDLLHRNAENSIDRIEKLIGPVLLLGIGLNLLWIVVSVLAPVYDVAISTVVSS